MVDNIDKLLAERGKTHGDFDKTSETSQALKDIVRPHYTHLTNAQKESIDMILYKIARLVRGDNNHLDSWVDIQGYSKLAEPKQERTNDDDI